MVTQISEAVPAGLLQTIREALRGSSLDYTTAPVGRAVIMLAVPMVVVAPLLPAGAAWDPVRLGAVLDAAALAPGSDRDREAYHAGRVHVPTDRLPHSPLSCEAFRRAGGARA